MEKIKVYIVLSLLMMYGHNMYAQIGYQISLLNTATGEPRANETVNVTVTLTNSEGGIIYTGNQSATTNDFGVLSLTIGDADTFKEVDVTKMPFYVEVSANGVSIGKSQVLSVPIAEYAKRTGALTKDLLVGTWVKEYSYQAVINSSYIVTQKDEDGNTHEINIPYTYISYRVYQSAITFKTDGSAVKTIIRKGWTNGKKGREGVPADDNWDDSSSPMTSEYIIDGNYVVFLTNISVEMSPNPVFTHVSSPYAIKQQSSMYYFSTIGILGDGYTKLQ